MIIRALHAMVDTLLKGKSFGIRSSKWRKIRNEYLKSHNFCRACGTQNKLEVHHIKPFHLYPELELEENNLITLCESSYDCHLKIGHNGNWKYFNEFVEKDARDSLFYHKKIRNIKLFDDKKS